MASPVLLERPTPWPTTWFIMPMYNDLPGGRRTQILTFVVLCLVGLPILFLRHEIRQDKQSETQAEVLVIDERAETDDGEDQLEETDELEESDEAERRRASQLELTHE